MTAMTFMLAARGAEEDADAAAAMVKKSGYPVVTKPLTLEFFSPKHDYHEKYEDLIWAEEMEKRTGITVEWNEVNWNDARTRVNTMLAAGDLMDVFFRCAIGEAELVRYGSEGLFKPLNNYIRDGWMPALDGWFTEYPSVKAASTMPDGNVYGCPYIIDIPSVNVGYKIFVNTEHLANLGLDIPTTTEEFYDVLKAVKEGDANGNGDPNDEVPFAATRMKNIVWCLAGSWGLANHGIRRHNFVDTEPGTDTLRFFAIDPMYEDYMTYLHTLYAEGLIDQEIWTVEKNKNILYEKLADGLVTFLIENDTARIGPDHVDEYVGIPEYFEGPAGDDLYVPIGTPHAGNGNFVITKDNKYPEAAARWADYLYTEEGIKLFFMGVEGVSFVKTATGGIEYSEQIMNDPDGLDYVQASGKYTPWPGGRNPTVVMNPYFKAEAIGVPAEAAESMYPYIPTDVWPYFTFKLEELSDYTALKGDIEAYVWENTYAFIKGDVPLSDWSKYVNQVEALGLDRYLEIYTAAYKRYKASL
jgi:putative aldouronate transport system substrate-binding protein